MVERLQTMKRILSAITMLACFLGATVPATALLEGGEVLVVYNQKLPESKRVADHYATVRRVPKDQIIGLSLPTSEEISRQEYSESLARPLAAELEKRKLWRLGKVTRFISSTSDSRQVLMPVESNIRYVVLCYGVPLKIREDQQLIEPGREKARPELQRNAAAVDSELATLPLPTEAGFRFGFIQNFTYTTTNTASLHPTNGILMVARLDGPTPEIAMGLVDKAVESETNGYWGRAYFDIRGISDTNYVRGDQWIQTAYEVCRVTGFESYLDTDAATFPASLPLSQIAFYAGWYDASPGGPFLAPHMEFMPGAFAYHLHSGNAATIRSTNSAWVGPLLVKGTTCTMGSVYEPYLMGTPDIGAFAARWLITGFTFGEAAYASQNCLSWQTTVVGDPLQRAFAMRPELLQIKLQAIESPLRAWMILRVINLNHVRGVPLLQLTGYLESIPLTRQSAVLSEKLGDLNAAVGKPASTLRCYESALEMDPSPQQRIRLMLKLGNELMEQKKFKQAADHWMNLYRKFPDYPGRSEIAVKMALAEAGVRAERTCPPPQHP